MLIRHDVDHSLDNAMMLAELEHSMGIQSTYFMLHPGDYDKPENYYGQLDGDRIIHAPGFFDRCRELAAMGHEVGLHNDFIQLSFLTRRGIRELLAAEIAAFAEAGIKIHGSASHGSPAAGIIETYPLDWAVLQKDVASSLASVGYLNNALHLCDGEVAAAVKDFDADVDALRRLGLRCSAFMPWGRTMPSRQMPDPVFIDWSQMADTTPLWIYNRFGVGWTSCYVDTVLREALAGGDALDPLNWFSRQQTLNGRHLMLLHPHHYKAQR